MKLDLLVVNPVYVENLAMFLREAQLSGAGTTYIEDRFKLLDSENRQRLISWSGRVAYHNPPTKIGDSSEFLSENARGYRRVATVIRSDAREIFDFKYGENDLLVFGDERKGLDTKIIDRCDELVYIPQVQPESKRKRIQCRTLVAAQAIFLYEYQRQVKANINTLMPSWK